MTSIFFSRSRRVSSVVMCIFASMLCKQAASRIEQQWNSGEKGGRKSVQHAKLQKRAYLLVLAIAVVFLGPWCRERVEVNLSRLRTANIRSPRFLA